MQKVLNTKNDIEASTLWNTSLDTLDFVILGISNEKKKEIVLTKINGLHQLKNDKSSKRKNLKPVLQTLYSAVNEVKVTKTDSVCRTDSNKSKF